MSERGCGYHERDDNLTDALVRELALYYLGRDAECTNAKVAEWPKAAKDLIVELWEILDTAGYGYVLPKRR